MLAVALVLNVIIVGGGLLVLTLRVCPRYREECAGVEQAKKKIGAAKARRKRESLTRQVLLVIVLYLLCCVGCLVFLAESYYR